MREEGVVMSIIERSFLVYIAGPLGAERDWTDNVKRAMDTASDLLDLDVRIGVIVPHLFVHLYWHKPRPRAVWLDLDMTLVERADALFRIPGESPGSDMEVNHARTKGLPICHTLGEVREALFQRYLH